MVAHSSAEMGWAPQGVLPYEEMPGAQAATQGAEHPPLGSARLSAPGALQEQVWAGLGGASGGALVCLMLDHFFH
jgi:hypothetical protein